MMKYIEFWIFKCENTKKNTLYSILSRCCCLMCREEFHIFMKLLYNFMNERGNTLLLWTQQHLVDMRNKIMKGKEFKINFYSFSYHHHHHHQHEHININNNNSTQMNANVITNEPANQPTSPFNSNQRLKFRTSTCNINFVVLYTPCRPAGCDGLTRW